MRDRARGAGVVSIPLLDLRRSPRHTAEMRSQLLLGEVVDVLASALSGRWLEVRNWTDGYRGWVRSWGLIEASRLRAGRWERRARHRVRALRAEVRTRPGGGTSVSPLPWRARLITGAARGRHRAIELPDGRRGWVRSADLEPVGAPPPPLLDRIGSLIGVPYLWGGRSPAGFDCSGFTQLVMAEQGVRLPRDAADQLRVCRPLATSEAAMAGDLVFFGRPGRPAAHVGVYLGSGLFAHARGRVLIGSVDPDNVLYDNELNRYYLGLARVRPGWRPSESRIALTRIPQLP
jgi:hypothetical protein